MDQPAISAKKRVEKEVLDTIMDGLGSGDLDSQKAQDIARETLATLKLLDEHEESLEKFYKNLASKYPIFSLLYTKIRGDIAHSREMTAHRQALAAIDAGKIDEAHQIAKGAIAQTAHEATNTR